MTPDLHRDYDPVLPLREAASYVGLSRDHLAHLARSRQIGSVRSAERRGSPIRFRLSELNRWLKAQEIKPLRAAR